MAKYLQGRFTPKNPSKYKGDVSNIIYRSSWELKALMYFDDNVNVLEYSSEETIVRYRSPIDGKLHRYFVDFKIKIKDKDNNVRTILIEVKPEAQTKPPVVQNGKKPGKRYLTEIKTWGVNSAKWAAAREFCKNQGYEFEIITERHLFNGRSSALYSFIKGN